MEAGLGLGLKTGKMIDDSADLLFAHTAVIVLVVKAAKRPQSAKVGQ